MSNTGGELFERWLAHREGRPDHEPHGVQEASADADLTPHGDNLTPQRDHVTPHGDHVTPHGDHVTPRGDNVALQRDNVTLQREAGVAHGPDSTAAGAAVLAALGVTPPEHTTATPLEPSVAAQPEVRTESRRAPESVPVSLVVPQESPVVPGPPPAPVLPASVAAAEAVPEAGPSEAMLAAVRQAQERRAGRQNLAVPRDYTFKPRRATRTTLTTVLVAWVLASIAMGLVAYQERSSTSYLVAGLVVLLTAVTWAVRAGTTVARLRVVGGILQIHRGGRTDVFSLIDDYQVIEVVGRPGSLTWQVQFQRAGLEPYVVDGSMVRPQEFMQVLSYYRPTVRAVL